VPGTRQLFISQGITAPWKGPAGARGGCPLLSGVARRGGSQPRRCQVLFLAPGFTNHSRTPLQAPTARPKLAWGESPRKGTIPQDPKPCTGDRRGPAASRNRRCWRPPCRPAGAWDLLGCPESWGLRPRLSTDAPSALARVAFGASTPERHGARTGGTARGAAPQHGRQGRRPDSSSGAEDVLQGLGGEQAETSATRLSTPYFTGVYGRKDLTGGRPREPSRPSRWAILVPHPWWSLGRRAPSSAPSGLPGCVGGDSPWAEVQGCIPARFRR